MVSFGLHYMGYDLMIGILTEMKRVLKADGTLIILDYAPEKVKWLEVLFRPYFLIFESRNMPRFLAYY